eukprot:934758-Prorocentrum_minimum.AAC.1
MEIYQYFQKFPPIWGGRNPPTPREARAVDGYADICGYYSYCIFSGSSRKRTVCVNPKTRTVGTT